MSNGADDIISATIAKCCAERADLIVKMSWVIMREDGDWKIVNHHASSKEPLM